MEHAAPPGLRAAGLVLAAGSATRFGGGKLAAELDGRPVVRRVLDAAVAAGLDPIVIVIPPTDALGGIDLTPATPVINPNPEEGLSSSVRLGLRALEADADSVPEAAVILPADQPMVAPATIRALVDVATAAPGIAFVAARHADDGAPNPVLARRSAWRLADELAGDRGFGPVLAAHPELVREVPVAGQNPDVDTRDDLERLRRPATATGDTVVS
jgi:molybdenum cofactor cytidylyltransferase